MKNLRLLKVNYLQLAGSYKEFPKRLKWLCWHGFSLQSIPDDFPLEILVTLDMRYIRLKQVWHGAKFLGCLKILNLSHSKILDTIPDFSAVPNLERLIFKNSVNLKVFHDSIQYLKKLVLLNLKDCENLRALPRSINMLESLETLVISRCSFLDCLPVEMSRMTSLKLLYADRIDVNRLLLRNSEKKPWRALIRPRVQRDPEILWAALPPSLVTVSLVGCNLSDDVFPRDISHLSSLCYLDLSIKPIRCLPACIRGHKRLQILRLESCTRRQSLVGLPDLTSLAVFYSYSRTPERTQFFSRIVCCVNLLDFIVAIVFLLIRISWTS